MDFPKFQDLFNIGARQVLSLNGAITLAAVNRPGSDINVDVAAAGAIGDECIGQLTNVAAGSFLDSAKGVALDRLLFDRYGLLRNPSSPGVGSVQFQMRDANGNAIVNPTTFALPAGIMLQATNGTQYITTASEVYPSGNPGPITVAVASVLAGAAQQAAKNTITGIISVIPNAPSGLKVINPLATAGAADEESDSAFRSRGRAFFATARRGTLDAIVQGALAVSGVQSAETFELIDSTGRPARYVQLVITDSYTDALADLSTVPPTYQTQSQMLAANVFNALSNVRAGGIYVFVQVAQVILQPVLLSLSFRAGVNVDAVALAARAAVVSYTNELQPGTTWDPAAAQARLVNVPGLIITGNEIVSPAGKVVPNPLQVLRTTLAITTAAALGTNIVLQGSLNPDALAA